MLARPLAVAAVPVADRLASRLIYDYAAPWIIASCGLCHRRLKSDPLSVECAG
jgi:hypothetical protein